jgi:hypothetical protein
LTGGFTTSASSFTGGTGELQVVRYTSIPSGSTVTILGNVTTTLSILTATNYYFNVMSIFSGGSVSINPSLSYVQFTRIA